MMERLKNGQMRGKAIELGMVTEQEIDDMVDAWDKWSKTDDATLGIMNGEVLVDKK